MDPNETTVKGPIEHAGKGVEKGDPNTVVLDQQSLIRDFKNATCETQLVSVLHVRDLQMQMKKY